MKEGYIPKTSILGILGTSYAVQLGQFENKLAAVLYYGKNVIAFKIFDHPTVEKRIDQNEITNWIMANIHLPNVNPYQIKRTVRVLIEQFEKNVILKLY